LTRQRLAAYALVVDDAGRVLLSREPDRRGRLGRWLLPGGGVEHGEHPEQAVIREVREETGLHVRPGGLLEIRSDLAAVGRRRRILHTVRLIYRASIVAAAPESPESPGSPGPPESRGLPEPPGPPAFRYPAYARWCGPAEWAGLPLEPFTRSVLDAAAG